MNFHEILNQTELWGNVGWKISTSPGQIMARREGQQLSSHGEVTFPTMAQFCSVVLEAQPRFILFKTSNDSVW